MVQLNFNAAAVKPNVALEPIPSGHYPVIITGSQEKPTQKGDGSYIEFEMTIQGGEYNGRKVFDRLNIKNPNQQAVDIAYATLSAICHCTGVLNMTDTQQLHGRPFTAVVIKKMRNDQPEVPTNEVKGYKDINGNDPGFSGQVSQPAAQPGWAQQPPAQQAPNGGAPGWAQQGQPMQQPPAQQPPQQAPNGAGMPGWAQQQAPQQAAPMQQQQPPQQTAPMQTPPPGAMPPWMQPQPGA